MRTLVVATVLLAVQVILARLYTALIIRRVTRIVLEVVRLLSL